MALFSSKTYVSPVNSRKSILNKIETFYIEIENNRKEFKFKQNKIYEINSKYNVDMFSTTFSGAKAFSAEQKIREF